MMKSGLMKKLLAFLLLTLIINALLTSGVFTFTSRNVFANMKAEEMVPRVESISTLWAQLMSGSITQQEFTWFTDLVLDSTMWDASLYIYLADTNSWMAHQDHMLGDAALGELAAYLPDLLSNRTDTLRDTTEHMGIVVGKPIYGVDAEVLGVVFMSKPLNEVNMALSGLNTALFISIALIFIVMIPMSYFGSRSMTQPLLRMSLASQAMAKGDFTVRADAHDRDEMGQLGQSLNELSDALSSTIGALMLERNRLRHVLDGLYEGIVAVDAAGSATHCNPAAIRLLGEANDSAHNAVARLNELWPEIFSAGSMELPEEATAIEETAQPAVFAPQTRTVDCNGLQLQLSVAPVYAYDGRRAGAVAVLQNVTEQMRLEQTRREYVANVSHELRTPIASIRSLADALNDGIVKKEEDKARYYGYILRESMRLSRLIDDLLELSRLQSGGVALSKAPFSLSELLRELDERFSVVAGDSGLAFSLTMPEENCIAYSNEDRIEQVLVALLDNAIKYASDDGSVSISLEVQDAQYVVSVCNSGEIGAEHLPHLFERFYKADTAHTGGGTGLGLSISQEIITLLGETVWAENCEGEACFHLTIHKAK